MKKIITLGLSLFILLSSIGVFSINVEETTITLKPGLNSVSTPGLLKGVSFSNGGNNISFATLQNQKRKAINITNDNVKESFSPLTGFIVRNDTSEDVVMNLSYDTNIDESEALLQKNLDNGRNLLGITNISKPFKNIKNAETTSIIDLTDRGTNKIIAGNNFQTATNFTLGKAYGVFVNSTDDSGLYSGENNNDKLNGFTESECQEICANNDDLCPDGCRSGILSNNTINNTTIYLNDDSEITVYSGVFTANKYLKINSIYIYGNNTIPEGDEIKLHVYINNSQKPELTLNKQNNEAWPTRSNIKIKTGESIPLRIDAQYLGSNTNKKYNYKFKLLGNSTLFYETNPQKISLNITGDSDIPITPDIQISESFQQAYNWANSKGILNNQIIIYEDLNNNINNTELALFMNNYAKTILNRHIDTSKYCSFIDTELLTDSQIDAALESCQLGLIENDDNINFNDQSDLSTLSVLLSRALWSNRYNGNHLNALHTAGILKDINNPSNNELKGDILVALMNSEGKNEYRRVANSYDFLMNDFNAVEDVYSNIRASDGDRVIFIVRHSERIRDCTSEGGLTDHGIELAQGVGEKLKGTPFEDTSTDFYGSSTVKRTVQTSYYIGESRGSSVLESVIDDDLRNEYNFVNHSSNINSIVYGNYFSDGNGYSSIEHLYEENKDTTNKRASYAINKLCDITDGHPFSRITSHDWYTLPITEWATNETLTFSQSKGERPNFMQGVAVIVHPYGGWEIYPVRSLETGKIDISLNPSC